MLAQVSTTAQLKFIKTYISLEKRQYLELCIKQTA